MTKFKLYSIFLVFLLLSCKKKDTSTDTGSNLGSFNFTAAELAILPYPTTDTVVFKSSTGDSIIFKYQGRKSIMDTDFQYPGNPEGTKGNYYLTEENSSGFSSANADYLIFNLHFSDPFKEKSGIKYFDMGVVVENSGNCSWITEFRFNADSIISYLPGTGFTAGGYVNAVYTKMKLGPHEFQNVYQLIGPSFTHYCPVYLSAVYYTKAEGIVGFTKNTGKSWYLVVPD